MHTLYRLNADELDEPFLESLRALFKGKDIEISICEAPDEGRDETAYLLGTPANRRRLLEAIDNVARGRTIPCEVDRLQ